MKMYRLKVSIVGITNLQRVIAKNRGQVLHFCILMTRSASECLSAGKSLREGRQGQSAIHPPDDSLHPIAPGFPGPGSHFPSPPRPENGFPYPRPPAHARSIPQSACSCSSRDSWQAPSGAAPYLRANGSSTYCSCPFLRTLRGRQDAQRAEM